MAESLILILTPYEMQVVLNALDAAIGQGVSVQEERAIKRVEEKVKQMLLERAKDHP